MYHVGEYDITVQKLHPGRGYLAELIDLGARSDLEVTQDLHSQLANSVKRKASLYKNSPIPVILLVLDGFHIVDPRTWLNAAASIPGITAFAAVFRIKPANPPLLLASDSRYWPPSMPNDELNQPVA